MKTWNTIRRRSRVVLAQDTNFNGLDGVFTLPQGIYWITGFWANACGLALDKEDAKNQISKHFIPSVSLSKFEGVS